MFVLYLITIVQYVHLVVMVMKSLWLAEVMERLVAEIVGNGPLVAE